MSSIRAAFFKNRTVAMFKFFLFLKILWQCSNSRIARDVIALIVKPLDVKIADQRYVKCMQKPW